MKSLLRFTAKFLTVLVLLSQMTVLFNRTAFGQTTTPVTRQLTREKNESDVEEKRVALVIGNGTYIHTKTLPNPVNDANDMIAKLRSLGFRVYGGTNLTKGQMLKYIREFGDELEANGGVGLFFYGGHGVQLEGENYLIPVDADIKSEDEIIDASVSVKVVLSKMNTAKNDLNIILLDACRDNPFADSWQATRSTGSEAGLAKMKTPKGTVLFYATEPGSVASDGAGRNGLFTGVLLERMSQPDLELSQFMKSVIGGVVEKSKNKQTPWSESSFAGDFYFVKNSSTEKTETVVALDSNLSAERQNEENTWKAVKDSNDPQELQYFLEEFPNGFRSQEAKNKIDNLSWEAVKNSNNKEKIQAYLDKYPKGLNSGVAKITLRKIIQRETTATQTPKVENTTAETALPKTENTVADASTRQASPPEKTVAENKTETQTVPMLKTENTVVSPPKTENKPLAKMETETVAVVPRVKVKTPALKVPPARLPKVKSQTDSLGIEFVQIPAGSFMMGASAANISESKTRARKDYADFEDSWIANEKPAHKVEIPEAFWMGKTEVTQEQWEKVMGNNPSINLDCAECPVERVSWEDAKEFIKKLNALDNGFVYSLPTEAEWEYAARGGTTKLFAGNIEEISWHSGNSESKTQSVASRFPNSFGLYDMNGNVAEWCEDLYAPYPGADVEASTETVSTTNRERRVVRGGDWNVFPTKQRSTARIGLSPSLRNIVTGFRLAARLK